MALLAAFLCFHSARAQTTFGSITGVVTDPARLKLFQKCPLGAYHFTDIEGVYIDVANGEAH